MKILYVHQYFNTLKNSGGTRSYEFAKRFINSGHDVHIITTWRLSKKRSRRWVTTIEEGITVHWFPIVYSNKSNFVGRIFAFSLFVVVASIKVLQLKSDLVFTTSTPLTTAIPGLIAKIFYRIPFVFEVRDVWPKVPIALGVVKNPLLIFLARWLEQTAYKYSDAIVTLSPDMKRDIAERVVATDKIAVIPNSCDLKMFRDADEEKAKAIPDIFSETNSKFLIYTGTFGKVNGLEYLIKLSGKLKDMGSNVKVILVGDGIEKDYLESLASDMGVYNTYVFFQEPIKKSQIPAYLQNSHMGTNIIQDIPELFSNSANKFFDTIAAGKPVFINHGGWMKEIIDRYSCGLAITHNQIDLAAKKLDEKLNDDAWLLASSANALNVAELFFSRDQHAKQLLSIFEEVQKGRGILQVR